MIHTSLSDSHNETSAETLKLHKIIEDLEGKNGELREKIFNASLNEQLTKIAFERLPDGIILLDESHIVRIINSAAARLINLRRNEVLYSALTGLENDNVSKLWVAMNSTSNSTLQEVNLSDEVTIEFNKTITINEGRTFTLLVLRDVTREKTLKELKGEFVSIAAHQLRTPLAAIKWAFEIAMSGLIEGSEPYKAAERGKESSMRMLNLVNSLLDVDRIESGRFDYRFEKLDIAEIIRLYSEEVMQEKALLHGVRVTYYNEAKGSTDISADPEKFRLILQNLLENALKYTPQGGQIRITLESRPGSILLKISDTGIGIPIEAQEHLFEKFFRADNAKRFVANGSGLGLYIIKRIVESHGGSITFESTPGKGTSFSVIFPLYIS
jgi:signal transduction histidine kinase